MEDISKAVKKDGLDVMLLRWKCLSCGYLYEGFENVKKCPKCGEEDSDKFSDVD